MEVALARPRSRPVQGQVFPVADAWPQADAEHPRESKDGRRLALRVGADRVGWDAEPRWLQRFNHVNALPNPRWDEFPEYRDVVIGDVPVSHRAHFAVAEMLSYQKIVLIEIELRPIGAHHGAVAPRFGQIELPVALHQLAPGCF